MSLWIREGDKLCLRDKPEDFLKIIKTDGCYPETVECEDAAGCILEFRQWSPHLYVFSRIVSKGGGNAG